MSVAYLKKRVRRRKCVEKTEAIGRRLGLGRQYLLQRLSGRSAFQEVGVANGAFLVGLRNDT